MNGLNQIKVFKPGSKKGDFTIMAKTPEVGIQSLSKELGKEAGDKARAFFSSLLANGGEYASFRHGGRRIKVELAKAA